MRQRDRAGLTGYCRRAGAGHGCAPIRSLSHRLGGTVPPCPTAVPPARAEKPRVSEGCPTCPTCPTTSPVCAYTPARAPPRAYTRPPALCVWGFRWDRWDRWDRKEIHHNFQRHGLSHRRAFQESAVGQVGQSRKGRGT